MKILAVILIMIFFLPSPLLCASAYQENLKKINPQNLPLGSNKDDPRRNNYKIIRTQPESRKIDKSTPGNIQRRQEFLKRRLTGR